MTDDVATEAATETALADRVWGRDETLWGGPGMPEIADRLGWLTIADRMSQSLAELSTWVDEVHGKGYDQTVLLGMGGSSLGPEVLRLSFGKPLHMLDSTDPAAVRAIEAVVDVSKTMFVVSSKSGGTVETLSHFKHFFELTGGNGEQFAAVTDPGSPLAALAVEKGFSKVWLADPEIGGRYSVLSYFGLVPATLAGVPLVELLDRALAVERDCHADDENNPGVLLGTKWGELSLAGRDKLTFAISGPIGSFGLWAEQLIAESTGKHGRGILPVAGEAVGVPGDYGDDRVFVHIRVDDTHDAAMLALANAGQPVFTVSATDANDLGHLFFLFEFATAIAGHKLEINPFDQPNVQEAKDATKTVLESGKIDAPFDDASKLAEMVAGLTPPSYIATLGYLAPSTEFDAAVDQLRLALRKRTACATTFGYGPRYLHSTGQLHKGGPETGHFIQLVHDEGDDVPVPEADYSFRTLKHAQAIGDLQALQSHHRPVVRLKLTGDPASALRELIKTID